MFDLKILMLIREKIKILKYILDSSRYESKNKFNFSHQH